MSISRILRVSSTLIILFSLGAGSLFSEKLSPEQKTQKAISTVWWHQSNLVSKAQITPQQQAAMDAEVLNFFKKVTEIRKGGISDRRDFTKALESGNFKAAALAAQKVAERSSTRELAVRLLKINVLSKLSEQQRAALLETDGQLIRRQWFSMGNASASRTGKSRGKTRRRQPRAATRNAG